MRVVDFRSDTVTLPTPEMRQAMATAELGDDVYGEDPSVNRLEALAAETLGKEAAVLVSSGTQGNLSSVLAHCGRGDEAIIGHLSHIYRSEAAGTSVLGGVALKLVENDEAGMLDPDALRDAVSPPNVHFSPTKLIALENTHNACGGAVLTPEDTAAVASVAQENGIALHIDGARIFNAAVSLETPVAELAKHADTVTFCLSKGLSAPVGSVVCGSREAIENVRRWRKVLGGSMRQAGIIASAGIVALETMVERLAEDHSNARRLANGLAQVPGIEIDPEDVHTNLVFFNVTAEARGDIHRRLTELGVKGGGRGERWRYVTHSGVSAGDVDHALDVVESVFREYAPS